MKVFTKTGHLFAEFTFNYDHARQASGHYIQYRRLYRDDEEDESKSVYPSDERDVYLDFKQFDSIEKIKAYDKEVIKRELGHDMTDPRGYDYVYDTQPVLLRYVVANHVGCIGMINVLFSFVGNTKEVKFLSATNPRYDFDISSNSLETNIDCILRIPVYPDRDVREMNSHDLQRLPPWY